MTVAEFDLCGPLPEGTTVLEASAGTGKTWTIAGLAVRYLAEGHARVDQLMLVTFGRAATAELRDRVRSRLVEVVRRVTAVVEGGATPGDDMLVAHLTAGDSTAVRERLLRLRDAQAELDAATIATTHGFCSQMLSGLGLAADIDHGTIFDETATADLLRQATDDLYLAGVLRGPSLPSVLDRATATRVGADAVHDHAARLEPADAEPNTPGDLRYRFARRLREEVRARKRRARVMDFDDLLVLLDEALADDEVGEEACHRIRDRYRVILVDEFQDTDPVQWSILRRTFHGHRPLVLIGDPKQAIYAFRGGDVTTYLQAREVAATTRTLATNHRSDRRLVSALSGVLSGAALGDPAIRVHEVGAVHDQPGLTGAPVEAPLRIRRLHRLHFGKGDTAKIPVGEVRPRIAADVAADIARLLSSEATVVERDGTSRPVRAKDVAVLVQRSDDADNVHDALGRIGVPAVLTGLSSVFSSPAAEQWTALLSALEQPQRAGLTRGLALTYFVGWSPLRLASASDDDLDRLGARVREWADVLGASGVAPLLELLAADGLVPRVLARADGERELTDLRHLGQALHRQHVDHRGGISSLLAWLQRRRAEATGKETQEERSRRLDSDAEAVQVLTVWTSKGLEFPVVYAPFLWDRWVGDRGGTVLTHDEDGQRIRDVGEGPDFAVHQERAAVEDAGESLRVAYVALTRASSQLVAHWAPTSNTPPSALHRLLFRDHGPDVPDLVTLPSDRDAEARFAALSERVPGVVVETVPEVPSGAYAPPRPVSGDLELRRLGREPDRDWTRTSYSRLTSGLHDSPSGPGETEPEEPVTTDEPDGAAEPVAAGAVPPGALPSPMSDLPAGAVFGTVVHSVLELVDFASEDLVGELTQAGEVTGAERFGGVPPDVLAHALVPSLRTPLGPLAGGRSLAELHRRDRLDELDFELPLAGGDDPVTPVPVGRIADLVGDHLTQGDPLHGYHLDLAGLGGGHTRRLRGFLTGSIDLTLRVERDGAPRHLVVDYKTNRLGGELITSADYAPAHLARAMRAAHYPLQALLYSVALHRYLRWRQRGYDPATHLGGVLYLFLRGMCGPETPTTDGVPHGVFSWQPPPDLVTDLSDLLAGGES